MKKFRKRFMSAVAFLAVVTALLPAEALSGSADEVLFGDIDGDGVVDAVDSFLVLRYSVGLENLSDAQLSIAGLNNDKTIDSVDALLILRKSVALDGDIDVGEKDEFKDYAVEILDLVNAERAKNNLKPLTLDAELCRLADIRSEEISYRYELEHLRKDGRSWDTILDENDVDWHENGENIGAGKTAQIVFDLWMQSPNHKAAILSDKYNKLGVGYFFNNDSRYGYYWTQIFTD